MSVCECIRLEVCVCGYVCETMNICETVCKCECVCMSVRLCVYVSIIATIMVTNKGEEQAHQATQEGSQWNSFEFQSLDFPREGDPAHRGICRERGPNEKIRVTHSPISESLHPRSMTFNGSRLECVCAKQQSWR